MIPHQKEAGNLGEMAVSKSKAGKILSTQTDSRERRKGENGAGGGKKGSKGNTLSYRRTSA